MNSEDKVFPILREFHITPEFIVEISKNGKFEVKGSKIPSDAKVRLDLTWWCESKKRLVIVIESNKFPDVVEEISSPTFSKL